MEPHHNAQPPHASRQFGASLRANKGVFKMKIPMNNEPLHPLPWDRCNVDRYPPGFDDTTTDKDDISTNTDEDDIDGEVLHSPISSQTPPYVSHGPPQPTEEQHPPMLNARNGYSGGYSRKGMETFIPENTKNFNVMMEDGTIQSWSIIWTSTHCRVGHGWYEYCKTNGCLKNDKLIF
ncbi:hypothetical protein SESBI_32331 [Sesbania bispinosa]|nr:hypothetical protein SESBI_32331 [Sesbania bispinosa]